MSTAGRERQRQREEWVGRRRERENESLFLDDAGEAGETGSEDHKKIAAAKLDKWLELAVWKLSPAPCDLIACP